MSRQSFGPVQLDKGDGMESLSRLDTAGLLLGKVICCAVLLYGGDRRETHHINPLGDARVVPSYFEAAWA